MSTPIDTTPLPIAAGQVSVQGTFRSLTDGARTTVTTPGTAVQLTSTATVCKLVMVQALFTNTSKVAVGSSAVLTTAGSEKGIFLEPGASITVPINDVSTLYIDALVASEGVTYTYYV